MKKIWQAIYRFLFVPPENSRFLKKNQKPSTIAGHKVDDIAKAMLLWEKINKDKRD